MREDKNGEVHITNNFNAPIGQHIDHVDTINFRMDGDGNFHFGIVEHTEQSQADDDDTLSTEDERIRRAIAVLREERLVKHLYDYTWVMDVMNELDDMPSFDSPQSFLGYLGALDFDNLPDPSTIKKANNKMSGKYPDWEFADKDKTETNRRVNVAKRFLAAYRKGR